jgi:hypothetical protein
MTKKTFELWMNCIFFPALQEKRKIHQYQGNAVLILDGFSGHNYDKLEEQCTTYFSSLPTFRPIDLCLAKEELQ